MISGAPGKRINSAEINILENNCLKINNITFHYYGSYNSYENRKVIEYYKKKNYAGNIYLLGTGPLYNFEISEHKTKNESNDGQIFIESTFNSLKYISKYNNEITLMRYSKDEEQQKSYIKKTHSNNKKFVDLLKNNYKNSLFYCPRDLGIVGVEGYSRFYNEFYKYLDTVNKIYLINVHYNSGDFLEFLEGSPYKNKIINIDRKSTRLNSSH